MDLDAGQHRPVLERNERDPLVSGELIAERQATLQALAEKGGKLKLTQCGKKLEHLCVQISDPNPTVWGRIPIDRAEGVLNDGIERELLCAFEALQSAYEQQHKAWQESYANLASMYESTKQEAEISRAAAERLTRQVNGLTQQVDGLSKQLEGLTGLVSKLQKKGNTGS
ncbi:MbeD family mobilization/exclusion protein [Klebsiella pneumoniae]